MHMNGWLILVPMSRNDLPNRELAPIGLSE